MKLDGLKLPGYKSVYFSLYTTAVTKQKIVLEQFQEDFNVIRNNKSKRDIGHKRCITASHKEICSINTNYTVRD
jgi:hypothetical protein